VPFRLSTLASTACATSIAFLPFRLATEIVTAGSGCPISFPLAGPWPKNT
jgi:hypothetical protein